ncbi:MADS-box protein ggm13 [Asimina triloba]
MGYFGKLESGLFNVPPTSYHTPPLAIPDSILLQASKPENSATTQKEAAAHHIISRHVIMGRGKIEIKRIENATNRQVTFSKRRGGLLKKAHELAVLCDAQLAVIIFSASGKMFEYSSPTTSIRQVIDRYQKVSGTRIPEYDNQQVYCEMTRMKNENDKLQASMRTLTGEDLSTLNMNDLHQLEQQLEVSVNRVRSRKNQLLQQQMENLRRKVILSIYNIDVTMSDDEQGCNLGFLINHQSNLVLIRLEYIE